MPVGFASIKSRICPELLYQTELMPFRPHYRKLPEELKNQRKFSGSFFVLGLPVYCERAGDGRGQGVPPVAYIVLSCTVFPWINVCLDAGIELKAGKNHITVE